MSNSKAYIGHILVFTTIIIYSFNTNFMKILIPDQIGAFGLVVSRCLVTTICFWLIGFFVKEDKEKRPTTKDTLMIMLGGALGIGLNLLLYIKGLEMTGPIDTIVIRTLQPIIVMAIAAIFLHKKISKLRIIGIILGILGTLYISLAPHTKGVQDSFTGDILVFISTVGTAIYLIVIKPYTAKYKSVTIMKWMSLAALIVALPFGTKEFINAPLFHNPFSLVIWAEFGYIMIIASMVAYLFAVQALHYVSALTQSSYIYILPITGTLVAMLLKIQYPNWHDPLAFAMILTGFILINKKSKVKN